MVFSRCRGWHPFRTTFPDRKENIMPNQPNQGGGQGGQRQSDKGGQRQGGQGGQRQPSQDQERQDKQNRQDEE
jgi:hypothetical protein